MCRVQLDKVDGELKESVTQIEYLQAELRRCNKHAGYDAELLTILTMRINPVVEQHLPRIKAAQKKYTEDYLRTIDAFNGDFFIDVNKHAKNATTGYTLFRLFRDLYNGLVSTHKQNNPQVVSTVSSVSKSALKKDRGPNIFQQADERSALPASSQTVMSEAEDQARQDHFKQQGKKKSKLKIQIFSLSKAFGFHTWCMMLF
jgi:hypothetical protein